MTIDKDKLYRFPRPLHHWRGNARFRFPRTSGEWEARFGGIYRDISDLLGHIDASGSKTYEGFMDKTDTALIELEGQVLGLEYDGVSNRSMYFAGEENIIDSKIHYSIYGQSAKLDSFVWRDPIIANTARTYSAWIYATGFVDENWHTYNIVGAHRPYQGGAYTNPQQISYGLGLFLWKNKVVAYNSNNSSSDDLWFNHLQTEPISTGIWYHVACSFDGAHTTPIDTGKIYLNGKLQAQHVSSGDIYGLYSFCIGGAAAWSDTAGDPGDYGAGTALPVTDDDGLFGGYIDEVAVHSGALSDDQILSIYNHGVPIALDQNYGNYTSAPDLIAWWRMGEDLGGQHILLNTIDTATGIVLNAEPLIDGGLASDWTPYSPDTGIIVLDAPVGQCSVSASGGVCRLHQDGLGIVRGDVYKVSIEVIDYTAGSITTGLADYPWWSVVPWQIGPGWHDFYVYSPWNYSSGGEPDRITIFFSGDCELAVDTIYVRKVGNKPYQSHLWAPSSWVHRQPWPDTGTGGESTSRRDQFGVPESSVVAEPLIAGGNRADGSGTFQELSRRINKAKFLASDIGG